MHQSDFWLQDHKRSKTSSRDYLFINALFMLMKQLGANFKETLRFFEISIFKGLTYE